MILRDKMILSVIENKWFTEGQLSDSDIETLFDIIGNQELEIEKFKNRCKDYEKKINEMEDELRPIRAKRLPW